MQEAEKSQQDIHDKFLKENLLWAKVYTVPGAGKSSMPREDSMERIYNINISNITTRKASSKDKPGSSSTAVKDTPGKDKVNPVTNLNLPGHEQAGGAGQVHE